MGETGRKNNKYSYELKVQAVEDYLSGQSGGITTVAKKYELRSDTQLKNWLRKYREDIASLNLDERGRKSSRRPKKVVLDELSIKEQNEYLRMENAILKKAAALLKKFGEH